MLQKWDIPSHRAVPARIRLGPQDGAHGPGMRGTQRPRTMSASSRVRRRRRVRQAASAAGRVWAKRFGPGVRHRKRARRFGRGNRIRRCGADGSGRIGSGPGSGGNGSGSCTGGMVMLPPRRILWVPYCWREFRIRPAPERGQGPAAPARSAEKPASPPVANGGPNVRAALYIEGMTHTPLQQPASSSAAAAPPAARRQEGAHRAHAPRGHLRRPLRVAAGQGV